MPGAGFAILSGLLGGAGKSLQERQEFELKEREQARKEKDDEARNRLGAMHYTQAILSSIKDPEQAAAILDASKPSFEALGVDMTQLGQALRTIPGAGPLIKDYLYGAPMERGAAAAKLREKGLDSIIPHLDESRSEIERGMVTTEAGAIQQAVPGLGRTEATERARTSVAPGAARAPLGLQPLPAVVPGEARALAGAEAGGKVQGEREADPEMRDAKLDLLRAQAEAALRDPSDRAAIAFRREAVNAFRKSFTGEPLTPIEEGLLLMEQQTPGTIDRVVASGGDELKAIITEMMRGMQARRPGGAQPAPPKIGPHGPRGGKPAPGPGAKMPADLPPAAQHKGRSLTYKDGTRWQSNGQEWVPAQ